MKIPLPVIFFAFRGGIAQLVERVVRNDEAWGSNPHTSTDFASRDLIEPASPRAGENAMRLREAKAA